MRDLLEIFDDYEDDGDDISLETRVENFIERVTSYTATLPIRCELIPYRNPYTDDIQGVVLTDLYADEPGDGVGGKVMTFMINLADELELTIYTSPEGPRSKEFYEKYEFERNPKSSSYLLVRYPPLPDYLRNIIG